jgi:hypothetical protein
MKFTINLIKRPCKIIILFGQRFIYKLRENFFDFNLSRNIRGMKIVDKEPGFIIKLIKNNFFTYHLRPKYAADFHSISTYKSSGNDFAVCIQGPIAKNCKFVLETIGIYKKIFPGAIIIVTTWIDEEKNVIEQIKKTGVVVLQSEYPKDPGPINVNYQTTSTTAAIEYAQKNNITFFLKTRSDCRVYKSNVFPYLKGMMDLFPINNKINAKGRIIASSANTCKFKIYGLTDILVFGYTEDMSIYFSPELSQDSLHRNGFGKHPSIINETYLIGEVFLCSRYLKNIGVDLDWSLDHWWKCLKDIFVVFDADSVDFLWQKYDYQWDKKFLRTYSYKAHRSVEFSDWLALYSGNKMQWKDLKYKERSKKHIKSSSENLLDAMISPASADSGGDVTTTML